MKIAVSGTHFMGKSTLISDFIKHRPEYTNEIEAYYKLQGEQDMESALEPTFESLVEQLDYNVAQLFECSVEDNIIFDRCPIDYIAYAMCLAEQDSIDIQDTEIAEKFIEVKEALDNLDLIVFLPITKEFLTEYTEDNPIYRTKSDEFLKNIYRDDMFDIFPSYNRPKVIEVIGDRLTRVKIIDSYLS